MVSVFNFMTMFFKRRFLVFLLFILLPGVVLAADVTVKDDRILLPSSIVSLGSDYAVLVDKSGQKVYAFHRTDKGIELGFTSVCSTGMNGGSKEKTGDGRTPEGIYFATDRYTERELSATYGAMAFNLNYPNFIDHRKGRTGYNIWIHGTDNDLTPFQSNGCVVLTDENIRKLSRFIELNKTPIIIMDRIQWVTEDVLHMARQEFTDILDTWFAKLKSGRLDQLVHIYEGKDLVDRETLNIIADRILAWESGGVEASFDVDNVSILRHERHAVISFDQVISYRDQSWKCGKRVLFLGKGSDRWVVSGDILHEPRSVQEFKGKLAIVDAIIEIYADVEEMVEGWRVSWQSKDMERYGSYYASDFRGSGMNRSRWLAYKERIAEVNKNIEIEIGELAITPGTREARVSFPQDYRSSAYSDTGTKTLHLRNVDGAWKIYREMWEES